MAKKANNKKATPATINPNALETMEKGRRTPTLKEVITTTMVRSGTDAFDKAKTALVAISDRERKSLNDWLTFGAIWQNVKIAANGHKPTMGKIRQSFFVDDKGKELVSAQDASYAATMAHNWCDIEYYSAEIAPHVANPRVVVQSFNDWVLLRKTWGTAIADELISGAEKGAIKRTASALKKSKKVKADRLAFGKALLEQKRRAANVSDTGLLTVDDVTKIIEDTKKGIDNPESGTPKTPETPDPKKPETPDPKKPETPETPDPKKPETPDPKKPETPDPKKPETPETRKRMGVNEALERIKSIQPVLITAINTGELKGEDLHDLDTQLAAMRRAIQRALETAPTTTKEQGRKVA